MPVTRYRVNGAGTWTDTSKWSTSSGGASGASAPGAGDTAIFDALSASADYVVTLAADPQLAAASLDGVSSTKRLCLTSSVLGTQRTLTITTLTSLSNCDFMDILAAGSAAPFTGTSIGDCLGNSGITFTPSETQTFVGGTKSWSDITAWTSRVPLPQDDVIVNTTAAGTLTGDMPRLGRSIDFTGFTQTFTHSIQLSVFGSWTASSAMTLAESGNVWFYGRSVHTIISGAANMWKQTFVVTGPGGTYSLGDALITSTVQGVSVQCNGGASFNAAGFTVSLFGFSTSGVGTVTLGSGLWTMFGTNSTTWNFSPSTTLVPSTSTIKFTGTTSSIKGFLGGGKTYNNVWFSGTGPFTVSGSNTFNDFRVDPGLVVRYTAGTTQTVTTANISGRAATASDAAYGLLDGVTGSCFTTPDSAATSITTSLEVEVRTRFAQWTNPSGLAIMILASKWGGPGQYSWEFYISGLDGTLGFASSADGTTFPVNVTGNTSAGSVFSAGSWGWLKATLNTTTGQLEFLTAPDVSGAPGSYTRLGSLPAAVGATSIFDSTSGITIGQRNDSQGMFTGRIHRVKVKNGIGGTVVADFDPSRWTTGDTFTASTGEVWTRNGNAMFSADNLTTLQGVTASTWTIAKAGGGRVDAQYLAIRNSTATPGATWYAGIRSKEGGSNSGWNWFDAYDYGCLHIDTLTTPTPTLSLATPSITLSLVEC